MSAVDAMIADRAARHGDFTQTAACSSDIKAAMHTAPSWSHLTPVEREALDMIAMKIARICTGRESFDSFQDIAGYATLAAEKGPPR